MDIYQVYYTEPWEWNADYNDAYNAVGESLWQKARISTRQIQNGMIEFS